MSSYTRRALADPWLWLGVLVLAYGVYRSVTYRNSAKQARITAAIGDMMLVDFIATNRTGLRLEWKTNVTSKGLVTSSNWVEYRAW